MFIVELGENESEVDILARLRISCLRCVRSNVVGMAMRTVPMTAKINIFLFIDYIYRIEE